MEQEVINIVSELERQIQKAGHDVQGYQMDLEES
jgi:hypothetical protein